MGSDVFCLSNLIYTLYATRDVTTAKWKVKSMYITWRHASFPLWSCIKVCSLLNNVSLPLEYCSTLYQRVQFARVLLSLLSDLIAFNMATLVLLTHSSFSPSSRCLAPVCPPVLWYSCLRWRWVFHGNGTPHEDRSRLAPPPKHQGTKYLVGSPSPEKRYSWTGTGHWGGEWVDFTFLVE